jgi:hypothetical protein
VVLALLGRLGRLSPREVCAWLEQGPALAATCGLPSGRVIHPAHLSRRLSQLGAYPFWLLYLALVWHALRRGLALGRDLVLDSTLLAAWSRRDPDAAWSSPSKHHGRVFGDKVHVLLARVARRPQFFLVSPANRNDLPFASPPRWAARAVRGLPRHVVRADGADWGWPLVPLAPRAAGPSCRWPLVPLAPRAVDRYRAAGAPDHALQPQEAAAGPPVERVRLAGERSCPATARSRRWSVSGTWCGTA